MSKKDEFLDISAAGSALAGEPSYQAAEREVLEEIGAKLELKNIRPYFTINFEEGCKMGR